MRVVLGLVGMIIASGAFGSAAASDGNAFRGPWSGVCGNDVQCEVDFKPVADAYEMTLRVSDAMDDSETVCVLEADLVVFATDVLVSGDRSTRVMRARTGELIISGLPNDECSGADVNGAYVQFADE